MHRSRAFLIVTALTLLSAWRLLLHFGSSLPSDLGDPILGSWIFWWNANALPLTDAWWSAPMYAPMAGTFAFSEALLAMAPISTPLQWLGVNPVATHNVLYLLSYPMAGLGAYVLAFKVTKRHDASLLAAFASAFNPYRIAQMPHIQILWSCWLPLALAALHDFIETPTSAKAPVGKNRTRALVMFGACWMMNGFTNGYVLVYFPILVGLWVLWFARQWKTVAAIGAAAFVASLPIVPMLLGYAKWQHLYGFSRGIAEIRTFSADLFALFAVAPRAWLPATWGLAPGLEGELYPGAVLLVLALLAIVAGWQHAPAVVGRQIGRRILIGLAVVAGLLAIIVMLTGGSELNLGPLSISMHRPSRLLTVAFWLAAIAIIASPLARRVWRSRSPLAFYAIAAAVMYFFALGPEPHAGATQILYKPPYAWLMYLPGFDSVRVPARFGLLMLVCLAQVGAIMFARLTAGKTHARAYLSAAVAVILLEGWIVIPVVALPPALDVPQRVKDAGATVLEVPVTPSFQSNTIALYNQMTHGRPTVNGFGGYMPPNYYALYLALHELDVTAYDAVRSSGPVAVFVDASRDRPSPEDLEPNPEGAQLALVARVPGAELIETTPRGTWYLLPGVTRTPFAPPPGARLTPTSVVASANGNDAHRLVDGDLKTRWYGDSEKNSRDDTITLEFAAPAEIHAIEFDQSLWTAEYARDLEVIVTGDQGEQSVFRGSLAAPAMLGWLQRSSETPIRIDVPGIRVRSIRLVSHPARKLFTWSVGEIKVFGRQ